MGVIWRFEIRNEEIRISDIPLGHELEAEWGSRVSKNLISKSLKSGLLTKREKSAILECFEPSKRNYS